jgi:hypothetical protein
VEVVSEVVLEVSEVLLAVAVSVVDLVEAGSLVEVLAETGNSTKSNQIL